MYKPIPMMTSQKPCILRPDRHSGPMFIKCFPFILLSFNFHTPIFAILVARSTMSRPCEMVPPRKQEKFIRLYYSDYIPPPTFFYADYPPPSTFFTQITPTPSFLLLTPPTTFFTQITPQPLLFFYSDYPLPQPHTQISNLHNSKI